MINNSPTRKKITATKTFRLADPRWSLTEGTILIIPLPVPYYMKFSQHINFAILRSAYLAPLKFRDFAK